MATRRGDAAAAPWKFGRDPRLRRYVASALPRALVGALPLALLGAAADAKCRRFVVGPAAASVALLSLLPHKELRFAFPALPLLTLGAAVGAARLWDAARGRGRVVAAALRLAPLGLVAATVLANVLVFSAAARVNYPGGVALRALHDRWGYALNAAATVHIDDRAATTGASRFGEELVDEGWVYDKRDGLGLDAFGDFDFRLAELPLKHADGFDVVATVDGFAGLGVDFKRPPFLYARAEPALAVLRSARLRVGGVIAEPVRL